MTDLVCYLCGFLLIILLLAFFVVRSNNIRKQEALDISKNLSKAAHNLFNVSREIDGFRANFKIIIDDKTQMVIIMYSPTNCKKFSFSEMLDAEIYEDGIPLQLVSKSKSKVSSVYVILKTFSSTERLLFYDTLEATGRLKKSIYHNDSRYCEEYRKGIRSAIELTNRITLIISDFRIKLVYPNFK